MKQFHFRSLIHIIIIQHFPDYFNHLFNFLQMIINKLPIFVYFDKNKKQFFILSPFIRQINRKYYWVPLKTALKRENVAAVSKTRKGSEGLLVCRSAPLSRKLDTSPLPGRPRKVRRLDEIFDADDSFSLKWVFRGSLLFINEIFELRELCAVRNSCSVSHTVIY